MKKLLIYGLLLVVFFVNMGAGCGNDTTETPDPDNFTSLLGKWEAIRARYEITKQDGSEISSGPELKSKGVIIIWEFFKDGRMVATMDGQRREVRWELKVTRLSGKDIDVGQLKIIGKEEKELAQSLGQSGDLTYDIELKDNIMYLKVDATSQGPYKKNILVYTYARL
ncbi:hypothetical protein [Runella sp. SP2]|uniref:hypothetical protein n=1 Tax=Runella sp. SP2 TaxID=2268026 RepID=UPI000F0761EF|nr:hypothetical protein [Runella sp. SP2]AYQ34871.1 hypothetical protein DTQ70_23050 [Runella sp. SP2]